MSDMLLLFTNETQQQQQHLPTLPFDPALATFTPGMAKRATSVFATSPIVQGKRDSSGTPDIISAPNGTLIAGTYFYSNFDSNQGSVCLRVTPEWNGNDGLTHDLFSASLAGDMLKLRKSSSNNLTMALSAGISVAVDVSGWVAGTIYNLCFRWDMKNSIDGTNYGCISINDVHTFGAAAPSISAPTSTLSIGTNGSGNPANALIEGLTIFRRVLYDGTYGMDVNGGIDEVNLIAAGIDPTSLGGSWDVPFCLPTNQTAGALVSGTGEAWSHPWASNLLTDPWLSSYYGNAWGIKGNGTSTYVNCGSNASLDDLCAGGAIMQVEGWVKFKSGDTGYPFLISKGSSSLGWCLYANGDSYQVRFNVHLVTTDVNVKSGATPIVTDARWHHIVGSYNDTTKVGNIAIDGVWNGTNTGSGAYVSDATYDVNILRASQGTPFYNGGTVGWIRIHNHAHYTPGTNFVPPFAFPGADAGTVETWAANEGTGTTLTATVNAANNGTITAGTWEAQWQPELTPVLETSLKGSTTVAINVGSGATIDDLHAGAFTVEGWFCIPKAGSSPQELFHKGTGASSGWDLYIGTNGLLAARVQTATSLLAYSPTVRSDDNRWHHLAMTYDNAGDRKVRVFMDGVYLGISLAGTGAIVSDAATDCTLLNLTPASSSGQTGNSSWMRLSNSKRYVDAGGWAVPSRIAPPAPDANTVAQWNMTEGAGTAVADSSGNGNNGTISGTYTWINVPEMALDAPGARMFAWGMEFGSDAANDGIKQTLTGLVAATTKPVIRAVGFSGASGLGQAKIVVRDETNGADITSMDGDWAREIVTAGDMSDATKWTAGTGWAIAGGVAHGDAGTASSLFQALATQQNGGCIPNDLYKVVFTVSAYAAGQVWPEIGGTDPGIRMTADGTYTTYIRSGAGGVIYIRKDAAFHGSVDNVSVTRVAEYNHPEVFTFSFELPLNLRGAGADCTSISVKLLNAAGAGVVYWHQCEMLPNLLDNPSLDTGAVADPFIPYGWSNFGMLAGESTKDIADSHSGTISLDMNAAALSHRIEFSYSTTVGKFLMGGIFGKHSAGTQGFQDPFPRVVDQKTLSSQFLLSITSATWKHYVGVGRATHISPKMAFTSTGANKYDDAYLVALTDVSLTVTPASAANSLEGSGIRVDGIDQCTMLVTPINVYKGSVRFNWTPRHSAADLLKFGVSAGYLVSLGTDSNNVIIVYANAANHITLYVAKNSNVVASDWNCTGLIVAGTTYVVDLRWKSPNYWLYINGSLVGTVINNSDWIGIFPSNIFFGCQWMGSMRQGDAVFSAP